MNTEQRAALSKPFPPDKVKQKQGQGRRTMSYISHGLITERLNEVDPGWSMRPLCTYTYTDSNGRTHCEGVEIELTVCGVSRVEAGGPQRQDGFANEIKNAYSDALKRAAMRFGVALSMWESLVDAEGDEDAYPDQPPARQRQGPPAIDADGVLLRKPPPTPRPAAAPPGGGPPPNAPAYVSPYLVSEAAQPNQYPDLTWPQFKQWGQPLGYASRAECEKVIKLDTTDWLPGQIRTGLETRGVEGTP